MENMDYELTVAKWVMINQQKKTPNCRHNLFAEQSDSE